LGVNAEDSDCAQWNDVASNHSLRHPPVVSDYKNLLVWQKAHAIAINAHRIALGVRAARYSALRSQIIRAAMSIPANIVEGRRQASERDFARFLRYSLNSAYELEYHVTLARDISVIVDADAKALLLDVVEVTRMLHGLLRKISPPAVSKSAAPVREYESHEQ
jgi:four helix bundle protein